MQRFRWLAGGTLKLVTATQVVEDMVVAASKVLSSSAEKNSASRERDECPDFPYLAIFGAGFRQMSATIWQMRTWVVRLQLFKGPGCDRRNSIRSPIGPRDWARFGFRDIAYGHRGELVPKFASRIEFVFTSAAARFLPMPSGDKGNLNVDQIVHRKLDEFNWRLRQSRGSLYIDDSAGTARPRPVRGARLAIFRFIPSAIQGTSGLR